MLFFDYEWPPLQLLFLRAMRGAATVIRTVTGTAPIALSSAISHAILSLTQTGKCTQASTPTPDAPVDIYCNNGAIKFSPNELDTSAGNVTLGYYIEKTTGQVRLAQGNSNFMCEAYMPVVAGESYIAYGRKKNGGELAHYCRIAWYRADKSWLIGGNYTENVPTVNTAPADAAYARFSCNPSGTTVVEVTQELVDSYYWVFQEGTAEPSVVHPYVALNGGFYTDGTAEVLTVTDADSNTQTASVVDLLSVGPAADTQEIVGGDVERAITKFRVTSDMLWLLASGTGYKQFYTAATQGTLANSKSCMSNIAPYGCTASNRANYSYGCYTGGTGNLCFQMIGANDINTVDDWKAFLDENIAYVVAELATTVAEQVTPQPLTTADGNNTVSLSANVSGVNLTCEYKGVAT